MNQQKAFLVILKKS